MLANQKPNVGPGTGKLYPQLSRARRLPQVTSSYNDLTRRFALGNDLAWGSVTDNIKLIRSLRQLIIISQRGNIAASLN